MLASNSSASEHFLNRYNTPICHGTGAGALGTEETSIEYGFLQDVA